MTCIVEYWISVDIGWCTSSQGKQGAAVQGCLREIHSHRIVTLFNLSWLFVQELMFLAINLCINNNCQKCDRHVCVHAHAQNWMANQELLPPVLKHLHSALTHYMLLQLLDVFSQCVVAEMSVAHTSNSALVHSVGIISWSIAYTSMIQTIP